jgi:hypothetical protein
MSNNIKIYENFLATQMKQLKIRGLISEAVNSIKSGAKQATQHMGINRNAEDANYDAALSAIKSHPELHSQVKSILKQAQKHFAKRDNHETTAYKHQDNQNHEKANGNFNLSMKHFDRYIDSMNSAEAHHNEGLRHHNEALKILKQHSK